MYSSFRSMYLKKVSTVKQARNKVKALHPTPEFLFGGQTGDVCESLSNSAQLNPLKKTQRDKFPNGWKPPHYHGQGSGGFSKFHNKPQGFNPGFRGGSSSGRGRGGARGRGRGKPLETFKDN